MDRLIMQTWKTRDIPSKWQASVDAINKYLVPNGWKYVLMTDEDNRKFVEQYFPSFLKYYDKFEYSIQRADAIRYMWLYINGGLYMDLDIELLGDISEYFTDGQLFLVSSSNERSLVTNAMMASVKEHPFWLRCIEEMKKPAPWYAFEKHLYILNTTGPNMLSRVLNKWIQDGNTYTALPSSVLNPYSVCDHDYNKPGALIRPLQGSSWADPALIHLFHFCYCNFTQYLPIIIGIIIIALIVFFFLR